jgi:hypothetical protein
MDIQEKVGRRGKTLKGGTAAVPPFRADFRIFFAGLRHRRPAVD